MPAIRKTKAEKTREKIIETFFSLAYQSLGVLPNVSEICAEMDIYRSTFYNYFSSVNELVEIISHELENELIEHSRGIGELGLSHANKIDALMSNVDVTVHLLKKKRMQHVVLLCPELNLPFRRHFRDAIAESTRAVLDGLSPATAENLCVFVTEGVMSAVYQWLSTQNMPIGEFSRMLIRMQRSLLTAMIR